MTELADRELAAVDRFVSSIYWADDDVSFNDAFIDAIDEWTATAAAEHNNSEPFSHREHSDPLGASLTELAAAVDALGTGRRPGLTVMRALTEALTDWEHR